MRQRGLSFPASAPTPSFQTTSKTAIDRRRTGFIFRLSSRRGRFRPGVPLVAGTAGSAVPSDGSAALGGASARGAINQPHPPRQGAGGRAVAHVHRKEFSARQENTPCRQALVGGPHSISSLSIGPDAIPSRRPPKPRRLDRVACGKEVAPKRGAPSPPGAKTAVRSLRRARLRMKTATRWSPA